MLMDPLLPPPAFPKTGKREKKRIGGKIRIFRLPASLSPSATERRRIFFFFRKVCAIKIHWLTQKILPFPRFLLLLLFVFETQA